MNSYGQSTYGNGTQAKALSKHASKRRNMVIALASLLVMGTGIFL